MVVDAFLAATREGNFDALIAVLHPDVVLRADLGPGPGGASVEVRSATAVAGRALTYMRLGLLDAPALINGTPGVLYRRQGQLFSVLGFTVKAGRITEIDILADPDRLQQLDLSRLENLQQ